MTECEKVPLIEFVRAELDGPQTELVLAHLESCRDCRERVQVMAALAANRPAQRQQSSNSKLWLLAAGVVIAVAIPLLYQFQPGGRAVEDLATQEIYPAPFSLVTRDGAPATAQEQMRKQADQAYGRRDYQAAEALYAQLPGASDTLFYLGVCRYYLGRHEVASETLGQVVRNEDQWRRPALWYQASAYLKLGRAEAAAATLSKLKDGQDEYAHKARGLLAKLGSR